MLTQFRHKMLMMCLAALAMAATLAPLPAAPATPSFAQDDPTAGCNSLVSAALERVADTCIGVGVNEVCYGNDFISATLTDESLFFDRAGDIVPVAALSELNTSTADPESGEWGVALATIRADLPDSSEPVTMLIFGGARITPDEARADDLPTCTFTNRADTNLNLRTGPGLTYRVVDVLGQGEATPVYAQTTDGTWVRGARGWALAELGTVDCADGQTLQTTDDPTDVYAAPMQSFTLRVDDDANCAAIPSGMVIQTPDGQTANLKINGVELRVGSTAYVTVDNDSEAMIIANVGGNVYATGNGTTQDLRPGEQSNVPLNEEDDNNGTPQNPTPYGTQTSNLDGNLDLLPQGGELPPPAPQRSAPAGTGGNTTGQGTDGTDGTTGTVGTGQYLPCGSCNTCGYPADECITTPDGQCLWDPTTCRPDYGPPSGPAGSLSGPSMITCEMPFGMAYYEVMLISESGAIIEGVEAIGSGVSASPSEGSDISALIEVLCGPSASMGTVTVTITASDGGVYSFVTTVVVP